MDKKYLDKFYKENTNGHTMVTIAVPLTLLYNSLLNSGKHIHEQYDLTHTEMGTLISLYRNGGKLSPTELYKSLVFTSSAISKVLKKLELKKMISREPSNNDKRSMLVVLSKKGTTIGRDCLEKLESNLQNNFSHLDEKDKNDLERILKKMVYSL